MMIKSAGNTHFRARCSGSTIVITILIRKFKTTTYAKVWYIFQYPEGIIFVLFYFYFGFNVVIPLFQPVFSTPFVKLAWRKLMKHSKMDMILIRASCGFTLKIGFYMEKNNSILWFSRKNFIIWSHCVDCWASNKSLWRKRIAFAL